MIPQALLFTTFYGLSCLAASFKEQTPPDYLIHSFPTNNVTVNDEVFLGLDGGALEVPHEYYGLVYDMSISITYPNGTNDRLVSIGTLLDPVGAHCRGAGSPASKPGDLLSGAKLHVDAVGKHTAFWNVTYGSSVDPTIANATFCDLSRLSYETWLFNESFNVVEDQQNGHLLPVYTTVTTDFPSEPTGKIFESNGAGVVRVVAGSVIGAVVFALCQNL